MSSALTGLIDRYIYPGDKLSPDNYRKGRFFIVSTFLFMVLALLGFIFMFTKYIGEDWTQWSMITFISNLILFTFSIAPFLIYRKWGKRILLVNIITLLGYLTNAGVYEDTGGIYSSDNLWGTVISAWVFLVADKRSGLFWFVMSAILYVVFYVSEVNGLRNFRADTLNFDGTYYFINFFLGACFLCVIIMLHEGGKEKYLKELLTAKQEIEHQKRIVDQRNKDITDSIKYAEKIQRARIATDKYIDRNLRRLNKN